ncbi:MAG: NAD(P)/FAD-dependent oxidoreductase [Actinomycetota bacterium]|nr:NAD(P)/FAD-dependent oxidoreductase [Actinomycetota bacterium]
MSDQQFDGGAVDATDVDAVIVGAGFAGMYMLHALREQGFTATVFEVADDVGGTWYWNRYPGARCDVESLEYSYSFSPELEQEWQWTERYAAQPEILRYAQHVADRFDLRRDIRFETRVQSADFDDETTSWTVVTCTADGTSSTTRAQFLIMAVGCLSSTNLPDFPGRDTFAGESYHTGTWPHEGVDFTGKRVAVIGTGSSAVQSIPLIAQQAEHLTVFQRTPAYTVPAHNRPLTEEEIAEVKADYRGLREANRQMSGGFGARLPRGEVGALEVADEEREAVYQRRWELGGLPFLGGFNDLLLDEESNASAAWFVRRKIAEAVHDPATAALLTPTHVIGCKRLCVDTGYYETFNRSNVLLVDLNDSPIERITPTGIQTSAGHHELDAIIFATGFDAMTGALLKVDIRGRGGERLQDAWAAGPRTYLGLGVRGFHNLFTITGPGSPSVLTNMLVSIQHHVEWIADCIAHLDAHDHATIEVEQQAQDEWVDYVNAVASFTLFPTCNSWYLGANVPGKTRVFMPLPGFGTYLEQCSDVAADGYRGFALA